MGVLSSSINIRFQVPRTSGYIEEALVLSITIRDLLFYKFSLFVCQVLALLRKKTKLVALKFCRIAEGQADLYIKKGHTSSWDTAAGQCILEEAGGKVVDFQDMPLSYNSTNNQKNPFFLALGDPHIKPSEVNDRK